MISQIGWIDFSPEHRDKVTRVIGLLSSPGTVDELGIGVIRNAFSNRFFPGLSTIQTRAKYFIIVPRILREYDAMADRDKKKFPSLVRYLQQAEDHCNRLLVTKHAGENQYGIFGAENVAQNRLLQRMPSSVYWNGLRTYGLISAPLSLAEFLADYQRRSRTDSHRHGSTDQTRGDDVDAGHHADQPVRIPDDNRDWKEELSIHLSSNEAEYLQEAMTQHAPGSLLAYLLNEDDGMKQIQSLNGNDFDSLLSLDCIQRLEGRDADLYRTVQAASDFWRVMFGAHIRYNQLLQKQNSDSPGAFDENWSEWYEQIRGDQELWSRWDTAWLWRLVGTQGSGLRAPTRIFVESWSKSIQVGDTRQLDGIVANQERLNKGTRARLRTGGERVAEGQWIGISSLSYRLPTARRIVQDIAAGLDSGATS